MNNNIYLYGKEVKEAWLQEIKNEIKLYGLDPLLVIVQIGDSSDSNRYIKNKINSANKINMKTKLIKLPIETTQSDLLSLIDKLNKDIDVNGIIVQLPLPKHIDELAINKAIDPLKDVDGFKCR